MGFYYLEIEKGEAFPEQQLKQFAKEYVFLQLSLLQLQDGQLSEEAWLSNAKSTEAVTPGRFGA